MPNPYLPNTEHIPDGEPRVFGDRVYIYGSHDFPASAEFCDNALKVWSASVDNLEEWTCHGVVFSTKDIKGHKCDTDWTSGKLFAPDVVCKDGKYYLYAYIEGAKGCVAVSDKPEGPFTLISTYKYNIPNHRDGGIFIDPGVLVDDDGRVYIYCGYLKSYMAEINPDNMYEIIDGSYIEDIIPEEEPFAFFEACSPRKIGDTYYLIYSSKRCPQLVYATSKSPTGPFEYKGVIVDSGDNFPGGNDHGSIMKIKDQWYIFYHKMTNGSIMSRLGCVEPINILSDGTIEQAEMTSLGFSESLNPYKPVNVQTCCVMTEGAVITEKNIFEQCITNIKNGCTLGWKYFDFGYNSGSDMDIVMHIEACYLNGVISVYVDGQDEEHGGVKVGEVNFNHGDSIIKGAINVEGSGAHSLQGRHSIFFKVNYNYVGWGASYFDNRNLFDLKSFVFVM